MRKTIWMMAAALAMTAAGPVAAAAQEARLVTMTGYGSVQGTPDRAWVTVGVEKRDSQTKIAQEQTAIAMEHIQQRLKALAIPLAAVRTSSFNVQQDWQFQPGGQRTLRGYIVSNQIEVRVDDITKVPAVIDGSIDAGANIIHGVRWDMKSRDELEQRALALAFADARKRAEVIATASGARLGAVYAVQEARPGQVRPMVGQGRMGGGPALAVAESVTVINPGEMEIRTIVTVSFLIQS
jgi:uncharacterized protein YggE